MSQTPNEPEIALEQMLRAWGADEAAASAQAPLAPDPNVSSQSGGVSNAEESALLDQPDQALVSPATGGSGRIVPWVVAATVLLVAGGYATHSHWTSTKLHDEMQTARSDLLAAQVHVETLELNVDDLQQKLASVSKEIYRLDTESARLRKQLLSVQTEMIAGENALADKTRQLARTKDRLAEFSKQTDALVAEKDRQIQQLVQDLDRRADRMGVRSTQLDRKLAEADRSIRQGRIATAEAQALKAHNRHLFESAQRAYLSARAPEASGLLARQLAARRGNLIARAKAVRAAGAEPTRRLIEQLEVILTRLQMVDPTQPRAVEAFQSLLTKTGVLDQLNTALAGKIANPLVRTWLFETRMILG